MKTAIVFRGYIDWVYPWRIAEGEQFYMFGDHWGYCPVLFEGDDVSELKPCPFCGGKVKQAAQRGEGFAVSCHCGAEYSGLCAAADDLHRGWNRRAAPPPSAVAWGTMQPGWKDEQRTLLTDKASADAYNDQCYELTPLYAAPPQLERQNAELIQLLVDLRSRVEGLLMAHGPELGDRLNAAIRQSMGEES